MKSISILACNNCADGEVEYTVEKKKDAVSVSVKKCTSCGKQFGAIGCRELKQKSDESNS